MTDTGLHGSESEVVARLREPASTIEAALREPPHGLPAQPGLYAWWQVVNAVPDVPLVPHPLDATLSLLYVGIAPTRATSRQSLRARVRGNHVNGNTGSSTFRFVLASFLLRDLDLHPLKQGKDFVLPVAENARLREWQYQHVRITWCVRAEPWEIEDEVIAEMRPPLNVAGNMANPFWATVRARRAGFRAAASL